MADFEESVRIAKNILGVEFDLKEKQLLAVHNLVVKGKDCFCILPTGYGKSLIYQVLPFVFDHFAETDEPSIIIVLSPLNAIIEEQIVKLAKKGISCMVLKRNEDFNIPEQCNSSLIFAHPEVIIENKSVLSILKCNAFQKRVKAVVVDEAHLVVQWKTFRPAYSRINMLGTIFPAIPFLVLTGTANASYQKEIIQSVGLNSPVFICESPNRPNIFFAVHTRPNREDKIESVATPLALKLKNSLNEMPLTIVFSDLQTCAECYSIFDAVLGDDQYFPRGSQKIFKNRLFAQYHAQYPEKYKTALITSLIDGTCVAKVLFVTVAFGIGVDCPNVDHVIHIGVPCCVEDFYQEMSRAGRGGQPVVSDVYYNSYDISNNRQSLQDTMRLYVQATTCRRKILLEYFGFSLPENQSLHNCCDNCQKLCICSACKEKREDAELVKACAALDCNTSGQVLNSKEQKLPIKKYEELKNQLREYRMASSNTAPYVGITFTTGLSDQVIDLILTKFYLFNHIEDLENEIPLFSKQVTQPIWQILHNFK